MIVQGEAYERFLTLHQGQSAFVLGNAWDAASAVILREASIPALGTSSAAIAYALGRADGAHAVSLDEAIANARMLAEAAGLPINGDLEDGFGPDPEHCVMTVEAAIAGGLAGLGIEDTTADPSQPIHGFDAAVARIVAAAKAARGRIVLTARTDLYLHGQGDLDEVVRRLAAFAEAGADVLYAPALPDIDAIHAVVRAVAPRPVNVLLGPWGKFGRLEDLSAAGVKRVSLGGALFGNVMGHLGRVADRVMAGDLAAASEGRTTLSFNALFG